MRKFMAKNIIFSLLFFALPFFAESQKFAIDFYGIVSPDADSGLAGMTGDLFLAQISELGGVRVFDRRNSAFVSNFLESGDALFDGKNTSFYAIIKRAANDGCWDCTLYLVPHGAGDTVSYSKEFDSYYKIMTDAKQTIASIFEMDSSRGAVSNEAHPNKITAQKAAVARQISTDIIAGTWDGGEHIDRIVILRGGRGFIIFKNGASMSVSVEVSEKYGTVQITQTGSSNALYFPDLSRQSAQILAASAGPLSWTLSLTGDGTLSGTKNTFTISGTNQVYPKTERVTWTKR